MLVTGCIYKGQDKGSHLIHRWEVHVLIEGCIYYDRTRVSGHLIHHWEGAFDHDPQRHTFQRDFCRKQQRTSKA